MNEKHPIRAYFPIRREDRHPRYRHYLAAGIVVVVVVADDEDGGEGDDDYYRRCTTID